MGSETRVHTQAARTAPRPKWYYVYFLLAAFDLITVSAGL